MNFSIGDKVWWRGTVRTVKAIELGGYLLDDDSFAYDSDLAFVSEANGDVSRWEGEGGA